MYNNYIPCAEAIQNQTFSFCLFKNRDDKKEKYLIYAICMQRKIKINVYEEENSRNGREEEVNKNRHENRKRINYIDNKHYIIYRKKKKT